MTWAWDGFGISGAMWALAIMLVVAAGLTAAVIVRGRDIAYTLVILWAFAGIAIKQADTPLVSISAIVLAVTKTAAQKTSHASRGALSTQVTEHAAQTRLRAAAGFVSGYSCALEHLGDFVAVLVTRNRE